MACGWFPVLYPYLQPVMRPPVVGPATLEIKQILSSVGHWLTVRMVVFQIEGRCVVKVWSFGREARAYVRRVTGPGLRLGCRVDVGGVEARGSVGRGLGRKAMDAGAGEEGESSERRNAM